MSRTASSLIFAICCILLVTTVGNAKMKIVPAVSVVEKYNDNIFLEENDEDDDFITIISPRIYLEYVPNKALDLNLDYGFNFRFYSNHSELNDTSIRETQRANLKAQARPFNHVFINVSDTYRRVPIDVRQDIVPGNDFENMTDSNIVSLSPYVEIPITTTMLTRIGYRFTNTWFKADEGNNSDSHSLYGMISKKFPTGITLSVNYNYISFRPDLTDKYDGNQGTLSIDYNMSDSLTVWGGVGYADIDFESVSDENSKIWNVGAQYKPDSLGATTIRATYSSFLSNSDLEIDALHYPETIEVTDIESYLIESYFLRDRNTIASGISETRRADLSINTKKYFDITLNPYYKREDEIETDRLDKITGIAVNISKSLSTKLTASVDALYERQKFLPDEEKVKRYIAGGTLDYLLGRSITGFVGYKYNKRNSSVPGDDFTNNLIWIGLTITF